MLPPTYWNHFQVMSLDPLLQEQVQVQKLVLLEQEQASKVGIRTAAQHVKYSSSSSSSSSSIAICICAVVVVGVVVSTQEECSNIEAELSSRGTEGSEIPQIKSTLTLKGTAHQQKASCACHEVVASTAVAVTQTPSHKIVS